MTFCGPSKEHTASTHIRHQVSREKEAEPVWLYLRLPKTLWPAGGLKVKVKVAQSCPTLCDPVYYTIYGILQARTLEWVAFPLSRGSSRLRDWTQVSCIAGGFFTSWASREAQAMYPSQWQTEVWILLSVYPSLSILARSDSYHPHPTANNLCPSFAIYYYFLYD